MKGEEMAFITPAIESIEGAFSVKGYNVVVTGGYSGIGLGIATAYAEAGANVAILGRNPERGAAVAAELSKHDVKCFSVKCDVSKLDSVKAAKEEVLREFDHVDVLINCAGVACTTHFLDDEDLKEWNKVIDIDLNGVANMVYVFAKPMIEHGTGGSIINISSIGGQRVSDALTHPNPPYYAAKAGLDNFMRFLAIEFGSYGIRVNNIAPGPFHSQLDAQMDPVMLENATKNMPMHRFGETIELCAHCIYLSSPAGAHITGTVQVHDGGLMQVV